MPHEIITVDNETVSCDGGGGASGHPRVFLTMNDHGFVDCGYCGRRFTENESYAGADGHRTASGNNPCRHGHH
jgi:uncharacterized Zn-finger protein